MLEWSTDSDFWVRRVAIEHQLLRKKKMNTDLLAQIIENNLNSQEFFINKAIGWALRDYSKTNSEWARQFIAENYDRMAKLSITEGSKYLQQQRLCGISHNRFFIKIFAFEQVFDIMTREHMCD